jgi:hypothetical protein
MADDFSSFGIHSAFLLSLAHPSAKRTSRWTENLRLYDTAARTTFPFPSLLAVGAAGWLEPFKFFFALFSDDVVMIKRLR